MGNLSFATLAILPRWNVGELLGSCPFDFVKRRLCDVGGKKYPNRRAQRFYDTTPLLAPNQIVVHVLVGGGWWIGI